MARGQKKVTVLALGSKDAGDKLELVKATLRTLRSLGVKFSVTAVDGEHTTVEAWVEQPESRPRAASNSTPRGEQVSAPSNGTPAVQQG